MSIAENIKKIRKQNEITQEQLAEGTGYSRSMIARIECGIMIPNVLMMKVIADYFGVPIEYFLEE